MYDTQVIYEIKNLIQQAYNVSDKVDINNAQGILCDEDLKARNIRPWLVAIRDIYSCCDITDQNYDISTFKKLFGLIELSDGAIVNILSSVGCSVLSGEHEGGNQNYNDAILQIKRFCWTSKKKYWLHRNNYEWQVAYPLVDDKSYLSIGWCDFGNQKTLERLKTNFDDVFISEWGCVTRNRFYLRNFILGMHKDDIVVCPRYDICNIYKITEEDVVTREELDVSGLIVKGDNVEVRKDFENYLSVNGKRIDLGFFRKVEKVASVPRRELERGLYAKTRYLGTNINISDVRGEIDGLLSKQDYEHKNEVDMSTVFSNIQKHSLKELIIWYLKKIGGEIGPSRNAFRQADSVAVFKKLRLEIVVQTNDSEVDNEEWAIRKIQEYRRESLVANGHSVLWLISNCDEFPYSVKALAESVPTLLINRKDFVDMLLTVDFQDLR